MGPEIRVRACLPKHKVQQGFLACLHVQKVYMCMADSLFPLTTCPMWGGRWFQIQPEKPCITLMCCQVQEGGCSRNEGLVQDKRPNMGSLTSGWHPSRSSPGVKIWWNFKWKVPHFEEEPYIQGATLSQGRNFTMGNKPSTHILEKFY
jgi:hypothetical protein